MSRPEPWRQRVRSEDAQRMTKAQAKLGADIRRVLVIHRAIIADLAEFEDRVHRLEIDVRRLLPLSGQQQLGDGNGNGNGNGDNRIFFPPVLAAAVAEQQRLLCFQGVAKITREDMLRVFLDAVVFVREAHAVVMRCEVCVRRWGACLRRGRECWTDMRAALERFSKRRMG